MSLVTTKQSDLLMTNAAVQERRAAAGEARAIVRPQAARRLAFIAPQHVDGAEWTWLSGVAPMSRHHFRRICITNNYEPVPKATRPYILWQYLRAMRAIQSVDLAFFFSTDIGIGMTRWPSRVLRQPKRIYVGFTQDGQWPQARVDMLGDALRQCDGVTVFSHEERQVYLDRYGLDPRRVHVIPIHTDETIGYERYDAPPPVAGPYVLSMGSPNRRFLPVAEACHDLGVPLVIITRPTHRNDSLHDLANLGATIITNADRVRALSYLKHARLATMVFQDPSLPGAFTTLIHAMFLGTPSVVTSCLGMRDYVKDGQTGFITPHGDVPALRQAIERVWSDEPLRERFVCTGRRLAHEQFSLEAAARAFDELTEGVLAGVR